MEVSPEKYDVSERDYESDGEIYALGTFDILRSAIESAENYMQQSLNEVEYGIRFPLLEKTKIVEYEDRVEQKDFDGWNLKKKNVQIEESRLYTTREVWWCRLGVNIGSEQDGNGEEFLRPVIIVRGFGAKTCLVIPLTTSSKIHPLRISLGEIQSKSASALLSQIRVIDTRRLVEKICFLDKDRFKELRKAVKNLF